MARYTGPVCKLCRRTGEKLYLKADRCASTKCPAERINQRPGQTANSRRRKESERGIQLKEKQKVRYTYGVLEKQFRRYYKDAQRKTGKTGELLLVSLEMRMDSVVFYLGFGDTRQQARQLVTHGHFDLNGRKHDIASAVLKVGDVVSVRQSSKDKEIFKIMAAKLPETTIPSWLVLDAPNLSGRVITIPSRHEMPAYINEQAVVEYYSR